MFNINQDKLVLIFIHIHDCIVYCSIKCFACKLDMKYMFCLKIFKVIDIFRSEEIVSFESRTFCRGPHLQSDRHVPPERSFGRGPCLQETWLAEPFLCPLFFSPLECLLSAFYMPNKSWFWFETSASCLHLGPGLRQPSKTSCGGHIHDAKNQNKTKKNLIRPLQLEKNVKEP